MIFRSHHTQWLEQEYADLKTRHDRELTELRKSFQEQLKDVTVDRDRLRDELQRTRILLSPGLQGVALPHEQDDEPPPVATTPTGTPWQRVKARMWEEELARVREAKGESDGVSRQSGKDAPLGKPS